MVEAHLGCEGVALPGNQPIAVYSFADEQFWEESHLPLCSILVRFSFGGKTAYCSVQFSCGAVLLGNHVLLYTVFGEVQFSNHLVLLDNT